MHSRIFTRRWQAFVAVCALTLSSAMAEERILIDFGPNNGGDGRVTPFGTPAINPGNGSTGVADSNGNHWNNVVGAGATNGPVAMSYLGLVDVDNQPTKIGLTLGPGWKSNGRVNGGLLAPDVAKLGDLAIGTATEDYFFVDGPTGTYATLSLNNLDPAKRYNLRFFATRDTGDVRKTTYTVWAGNGVFSTDLQTSGVGLGGFNGGGNDSTFATLEGLQTDSSAQLTLRMSIAEGGYAYLGILEVTEAGEAEPIVSDIVRVDFGRHDGNNGNPTASPDAFGNHWNNFGIGDGSSVSGLVTTTNQPTSLGITLTSGGWDANGVHNGGLLAPSAALLGDLAVATATQDYFFIQGGSATSMLKITGLDPGKLYSMRFLGSRNGNGPTDVRRSTYTITAGNGVFAGTLETTGPGIGELEGEPYNGNDRSTVALGGIQAGPTGEVTLQLAVTQGGFAYLGVLEIVEGIPVPPLPAPAITNVIDRWVAQDALDPVEPGAVLFIGSSSIRRWESLAKDFADYRVVQRGFGGSQFSDIIPVIDRIVLPYQPSAIVVFAGTNDIRGGNKTGETVFADYKTFVDQVRAGLPDVPICYIAITRAPVYYGNATHDARLLVANQLIKEYCESDPERNLHFFDTAAHLDQLKASDEAAWNAYFPDGLHLSPAGYAHWTEIIRPALMEILPPNKAAYSVDPSALKAGEKLFFDFGPSQPTVGDPTVGPDANGNHWNNWHSTNSGGLVNSGEHLAGLVRSTGTPTGIRVTITGGFEANGKESFGGLLHPDPALLGEMAVGTATQDFFYSRANIDDFPGGFMIEGLDPSLLYEFRFFGSRNDPQTRVTEYVIHGSSHGQTTLQTSGTGTGSTGGNANDSRIAVVEGVRPDAFGQVFIDVGRLEGEFAYVGAMEILVSAPAPSSGVEEWRGGHFSPEELGDPELESTLWGNEADPDGDGLPNLVEYAMGTNPRAVDLGKFDAILETGEEGDLFTLLYSRDLSATAVNCWVEGSSNLTDWTEVEDVAVSSADGIEIRKASVPMSEFTGYWLRVRSEVSATD